MTWLNAALAFVFLCNLVFMVAAAYLLMRILDSTEAGQISLQKAASHVIEVGTHVKVMVRKAFNEMERNNDALAARESSSGRAVSELSFQIKTLVERVKTLVAKGAGAADSGGSAEDKSKHYPSAEDLRAKLHADLNAALVKNHQLQDEIDQTKYRLKDASQVNNELRDEIRDVKGIKQSVVDNLMQRTADLEVQLEKARERAKAAERHAENNAVQLDEIRAQVNEQKFSNGVDQTELIQQQQDQIDVLAEREKQLLARIEQLEGAFQRNQTEKNFIEERFLQMDGVDKAVAAPERPPAAE